MLAESVFHRSLRFVALARTWEEGTSTPALTWRTEVTAQRPLCKDSPLGPVNAWSMVMCSPFAPCFVTKPHRWHSHRRHPVQTFAVPGALTPQIHSFGELSRGRALERGEEEALPYRCDGCLGPLYVLPPLRGPTECSLCDERYTDWGVVRVVSHLSRLCEDHGSPSRL